MLCTDIALTLKPLCNLEPAIHVYGCVRKYRILHTQWQPGMYAKIK